LQGGGGTAVKTAIKAGEKAPSCSRREEGQNCTLGEDWWRPGKGRRWPAVIQHQKNCL